MNGILIEYEGEDSGIGLLFASKAAVQVKQNIFFYHRASSTKIIFQMFFDPLPNLPSLQFFRGVKGGGRSGGEGSYVFFTRKFPNMIEKKIPYEILKICYPLHKIPTTSLFLPDDSFFSNRALQFQKRIG